jgi:hypothetical protein
MDNPQTATSKPPKAKTLSEQAEETLRNVAATATAEDRKMVEKIITRAKAGQRGSEIFTLSPAACALLFLSANGHNRTWRATGPKSATEYARRMSEGQWKWNGETLGFYDTGNLSDGQHRLSGAALANYTLTTPIIFGVPLNAADTIDDGVARHGSDYAEMRGIKDAKRKQTIIKTAAAYFAKIDPPMDFEPVLTEAEVAAAIEVHDKTLTEALELAETSARNCAEPLLRDTEAARIAFVLLLATPSWPPERIAFILRRLQTRTSLDSEGGEKSPLFMATEIIAAKVKGKNLAAVKQVALVVNAALKFENGIKVAVRALKAEIEKDVPNPAYHALNSAEQRQAA